MEATADVTLIGALVVAAVTVIGWFATDWFRKRREEEVRRWESSRDHLHRQIEELYGPLLGLIQKRGALLEVAQARLPDAMREDESFDRSKFRNREDSEVYNYLVEKYLLPMQAEIASLLQTKAHLHASDDPSTSYGPFLKYQVQYDVLHKLWRETGIESTSLPGVHGVLWPKTFEHDVNVVLQRVNDEYRGFISAIRFGRKGARHPLHVDVPDCRRA
jgi:hypothetical protein